MKFFFLIPLLFLPISLLAQTEQPPSKEEVDRLIAQLNSHLIIQAAAAADKKEAEADLTRMVSVAIPVTEEMKGSGFACYLTTWHMSGRMIRYIWSVEAIAPGTEFSYFTVSNSTSLRTPKLITDDRGVVLETEQEWEAAENASQVAKTLGDISLKSEGIHGTIRTDSVRRKKSQLSGGLLHYPQGMSIQSGLNNRLSGGFNVDDMEKVEIQKHPGFGAKNFPPTKPNEFQCFYNYKY